GRQQIAGELHALPVEAEYVCQSVRECGLAHPGDVLDQEMSARQQARQAQANLLRFAEDHGLKRREHRRETRTIAELARRVRGSMSRRTRSSVALRPCRVRSSASTRARNPPTTVAGALRTNSSLASR